MLAVEEPESHLHPDAQAVLARHICDIAASPAPPALVVETAAECSCWGSRSPWPRDGCLAIASDCRLGRSGRSRPQRHHARGAFALRPPAAGWPVAALAEDLGLASELARLDLERRG